MKRVLLASFALLAVSGSVAACSSCGKKEGGEAESSEQTEPADSAGKPFRVHLDGGGFLRGRRRHHDGGGSGGGGGGNGGGTAEEDAAPGDH